MLVIILIFFVVCLFLYLLLIPVYTHITYYGISKQTKLPIKIIKKLVKVSGTDIKCKYCGQLISYPSLHLFTLKGFTSNYRFHTKLITSIKHPIMQICCKLVKMK